MKKMLMLAVLSVLFSCSPARQVPGGTPKSPATPPGTPVACPVTPPSSYHQVTFHFGKTVLPAKVGVSLDDIDAQTVRAGECNEPAQAAPVASIARPAGGGAVVVTVMHQGYYGTVLPQTLSLTLYDLGNCGTAPLAVKQLAKVPIAWKSIVYTNGATCAGQIVGDADDVYLGDEDLNQ